MLPILRRFTRALPLLIAAPAWCQSGAATKPPVDTSTCPASAKVLLFSQSDRGEILEGPVCVGVKFNALRYSAELGRTVSYTPGPNLATGFAAPPAAGGAEPPQITPASLGTEYRTARNLLSVYERQNTDAMTKGTLASTDLKALVSSSDDIYRSNGSSAVLQAVTDAALRTETDAALAATWMAADNITSKLKTLQNQVTDLLVASPAPGDADRATLTALQTAIAGTLTDAAPYNLTGDKTIAFYKNKAVVQYWTRLFSRLTLESFQLTSYVRCGLSFNQNKQVALRLLQSDRLVLFDGLPLTQTDLKDPFITVNCASPFVISAGVEIRVLSSSTFGLVPSGGAGANQFGITDKQDKTPLPIALVHGRLWEEERHRMGLYATFGAAAHIQGNGTGGSAPEYLAGVSVGLWRAMFLSAGWHLGKVATLSGGYKVGDPVPMGVTTVPVVSSYQSGFGVGVSFTKP